MTWFLVLGAVLAVLVLIGLALPLLSVSARLVKAIEAHRESVMLLAGATIRLTMATEASLKVAQDQIDTNRKLIEASRRGPMYRAMH